MTQLSEKKASGLRVIIVGGSVAGLTLAHALSKVGIDFVVLEGHHEIAPQVGSSIGILSHGARILDQIGVYDDICGFSTPLESAITWRNDATMIMESRFFTLLKARQGYPVAFLERQQLLQIMYDRMPAKESKILASKKVISTKHTKSGISVQCADGSEYSGDILIGADGVHSKVRAEMRKHIEAQGDERLLKNDNSSLSATYNCVFGIGASPKELKRGMQHKTYGRDVSSLCITAGETCYWFLFCKMDKTYYAPNIPRYTPEDAERHVRKHSKVLMTGDTTFGDMWKGRRSWAFVPLEEAKNDIWTYDRYVCVGDSISKMTPNMGAGGNNAIESAAALVNSITKLANSGDAATDFSAIKAALMEYQNTQRGRSNLIVDAANDLTRTEAMSNSVRKFFAFYLLPLLGDFVVDLTSAISVGASKIDALPVPKISPAPTMGFNPKMGLGNEESRLKRALYALPILGLAYMSYQTTTPTIDIVKLNVFDANPVRKLQMLAFVIDLFPVFMIWAIESKRRGNLFTLPQLPIVFAFLCQTMGFGFIAPIYYFLHYVQCPQEKYAALDNRMLQTSYAKILLPAVALAYLPLTLLQFNSSFSHDTRQTLNALWTLFPLWVELLQYLFAKLVTDTTMTDRQANPLVDLPYLRFAYAFSILTTASGYFYAHFTSPVSLLNTLGGIIHPHAPAHSIAEGLTSFLNYDQLISSVAAFLWILYSFGDLKREGKLAHGWGAVVGVMLILTLGGGLATMVAAMWWWREEVLAGGCVVEEEVDGKTRSETRNSMVQWLQGWQLPKLPQGRTM